MISNRPWVGQVTIGPWIERGFYYDFDLPTPLADKDLKAIKKEMARISKAKLSFVREEVRDGLGAG
jgi:threonyl-tRNA synthetase